MKIQSPMRTTARRLLKNESGQTATEYMLVVSVVVIALAAASYTFVPAFSSGVDGLARDVSGILDTGSIGGIGLPRRGGPSASTDAPAVPVPGVIGVGGQHVHNPTAPDPFRLNPRSGDQNT